MFCRNRFHRCASQVCSSDAWFPCGGQVHSSGVQLRWGDHDTALTPANRFLISKILHIFRIAEKEKEKTCTGIYKTPNGCRGNTQKPFERCQFKAELLRWRFFLPAWRVEHQQDGSQVNSESSIRLFHDSVILTPEQIRNMQHWQEVTGVCDVTGHVSAASLIRITMLLFQKAFWIEVEWKENIQFVFVV